MSTFSGTTTSENYTFETNVTYVTGLLQNTSYGINHNLSVPVNGFAAVDGLVAVLVVRITGTPPKSYVFFLSQLFFFFHCLFLGSHGDLHRLIYGNFPRFSFFLL